MKQRARRKLPASTGSSPANAGTALRSPPRDKVAHCAFAGVVNGGHVYELWYFDDEWCTAFVTLFSGGSDEFFESVQELIQDINLARQMEQELLSLAVDRRIRLWVGAAAFLAALDVVLGLAIFSQERSAYIISAVISVVASGCVAILGVWVPAPFSGRNTRKGVPAPNCMCGRSTTIRTIGRETTSLGTIERIQGS